MINRDDLDHLLEAMLAERVADVDPGDFDAVHRDVLRIQDVILYTVGVGIQYLEQGALEQAKQAFTHAEPFLLQWNRYRKSGCWGLLIDQLEINGNPFHVTSKFYLEHLPQRIDTGVVLISIALEINKNVSEFIATQVKLLFACGREAEAIAALARRWRRVPNDIFLNDLFNKHQEAIQAYVENIDDEAVVEKALEIAKIPEAVCECILGRSESWPASVWLHDRVLDVLLDQAIPNDHPMMVRLLRQAAESGVLDTLFSHYFTELSPVYEAYLFGLRFLLGSGLTPVEIVSHSLTYIEQNDELVKALTTFLLPQHLEELRQATTNGNLPSGARRLMARVLLAWDRKTNREICLAVASELGLWEDPVEFLRIINEEEVSRQQYLRLVAEWLGEVGANEQLQKEMIGFFSGDLSSRPFTKLATVVEDYQLPDFYHQLCDPWRDLLPIELFDKALTVSIALDPKGTVSHHLQHESHLGLEQIEKLKPYGVSKEAMIAVLLEDLVDLEEAWEPCDEDGKALKGEQEEWAKPPLARERGRVLERLIKENPEAARVGLSLSEMSARLRGLELLWILDPEVHRTWLLDQLHKGSKQVQERVTEILSSDRI